MKFKMQLKAKDDNSAWKYDLVRLTLQVRQFCVQEWWEWE